MADVQPFRAFRYNLARVGALEDVIAPPYDVIDADLQRRLHEQHPANVVRLILGYEQPTDNDHDNRATRSAACLREFMADDVLLQDSQRSMTVVHQEFSAGGRTLVRKGFIARVRLEPFGSGTVFPHEETLPGPKADRLRIFRATAMNLSPVFGLFPDELCDAQEILDQAVGRALPLQATDHNGVVTRVWSVTDHAAVTAVSAFLGDKPIYLADGHHRYETALAYLAEREELARRHGNTLEPDHPARFIMMYMVGMSDPGLEIQPTHRLVSGLPGLTAARLAELLAPAFELRPVGKGAEGCREASDEIEMDGGQDLLAFGTRADGIWTMARLTDAARMAQRHPAKSEAWRSLGVAIAHGVAIDDLLAPLIQGTPGIRYVHTHEEVSADLAASGGADLGILVPAATMDLVAEIASGGERMPAKSTYFYPKIGSGLAFHQLR